MISEKWPENGRDSWKMSGKLGRCSRVPKHLPASLVCDYISFWRFLSPKKTKEKIRKKSIKSKNPNPHFWPKMAMTVPSSGPRSVGNRRMVVVMVCQQSPRSRRIQRTSNYGHTTHRKKNWRSILRLRWKSSIWACKSFALYYWKSAQICQKGNMSANFVPSW